MTAPELLRAEMPLVRMILSELAGAGYIPGTPEHEAMFVDLIKFHRWMGWRVAACSC